MGCVLNCVASRWLDILIAFLLGTLLGAVGVAFIACMSAEGIIQISAAGGLVIVAGVVTISCMIAMLLTPWVWIVALLIGAGVAIVATVLIALGCMNACAGQGINGIGLFADPNRSNLFGDGPMSCRAAQMALQTAENALAEAIAERDAAASELASREAAAALARNIMIGAAAALAAAPFWDPLAVIAAIAALSLATAHWTLRKAQVLAAQAALLAAEAKVAAAEAAAAVARDAVSVACGATPDSGDGDSPSDIPSVTPIGDAGGGFGATTGG